MSEIIIPPYRTPESWLAAVDAEEVETNPLYVQGRLVPGSTWCNLLASNVTKRAGCEIPFKLVNDQVAWLRASTSWRECNAPLARARATGGYPTVGAWAGPDKMHGHIVLVLPSSVLPPDKRDQIAIAQAGRINFARGRLANGFDSLPVEFFTHD